MDTLNWIDTQIMKDPFKQYNHITLDEIFDNHDDVVRDYLLGELSSDDLLTLFSEWVEEQPDKAMLKAQLSTDSACFALIDWKRVLDDTLAGISSRELGDNFGVDWQGLKECFGIA